MADFKINGVNLSDICETAYMVQGNMIDNGNKAAIND
jgi:hypothetical protein